MLSYQQYKCNSTEDTVFIIILVAVVLISPLQNTFRHYVAPVSNHVSEKQSLKKH